MQISQSISMKFGMLPQPFGVLKVMLKLYRTISIQRRDRSRDFMKYTFNTGLRVDTWTDFIQTWYYGTHDYTLQHDFSLSDLDLKSRSHGLGKARTCPIILL